MRSKLQFRDSKLSLPVIFKIDRKNVCCVPAVCLLLKIIQFINQNPLIVSSEVLVRTSSYDLNKMLVKFHETFHAANCWVVVQS